MDNYEQIGSDVNTMINNKVNDLIKFKVTPTIEGAMESFIENVSDNIPIIDIFRKIYSANKETGYGKLDYFIRFKHIKGNVKNKNKNKNNNIKKIEINLKCPPPELLGEMLGRDADKNEKNSIKLEKEMAERKRYLEKTKSRLISETKHKRLAEEAFLKDNEKINENKQKGRVMGEKYADKVFLFLEKKPILRIFICTENQQPFVKLIPNSLYFKSNELGEKITLDEMKNEIKTELIKQTMQFQNVLQNGSPEDIEKMKNKLLKTVGDSGLLDENQQKSLQHLSGKINKDSIMETKKKYMKFKQYMDENNIKSTEDLKRHIIQKIEKEPEFIDFKKALEEGDQRKIDQKKKQLKSKLKQKNIINSGNEQVVDYILNNLTFKNLKQLQQLQSEAIDAKNAIDQGADPELVLKSKINQHPDLAQKLESAAQQNVPNYNQIKSQAQNNLNNYNQNKDKISNALNNIPKTVTMGGKPKRISSKNKRRRSSKNKRRRSSKNKRRRSSKNKRGGKKKSNRRKKNGRRKNSRKRF